jgi:3,4-dihydroxy 2-butanone 4-phosphate synthase/GTP cyclohydrolase II
VLRRLYQTSHQVGTFQALGFERMMCPGAHRIEIAVVLTLGEVKGDAPLLRIHPQCLTGDVLGSLRCDGGDQLEFAMRAISRENRGLLICEGRGRQYLDCQLVKMDVTV